MDGLEELIREPRFQQMARGSQIVRGQSVTARTKEHKTHQPSPASARAIPRSLSAHLHHIRLSCDPFCPWCRTTPESMEHLLLQCPRLLSQHSALRSRRLYALAVKTLNLPTLLVASGVHLFSGNLLSFALLVPS
ncbi:hypothetical protein E2C01_098250 [Portunus trituberculatus]|uniref:Uncharacterized protein n=1 Tax=Portunus trituberculatus TaxID=210409 RepID=A0A5B7KDR1_PORTR|nr:hypothetical protein [Portunus trituberculatus]